jgi:outer membrane protein TolC
MALCPARWRPEFLGARDSSWRAELEPATTPKPKSDCSGPSTILAGPAAVTSRPLDANASRNFNSLVPARPWNSTWPPLTWMFFSRGHPDECKRMPSAGRRQSWKDTEARRKGGVALKEDVLRADVQLSESREALVLAREGEFNAVARLNNAMGRNAGLPLEVVDVEAEPPLPGALPSLLELAADQRPEVSLARQAVAVAQAGQQAAQGEFLPRIFIRTSAGRTDGENVITGWQEGAGLHVESPLYAGGRHRGELRSADADIEAALADAQVILDAISLQVNVAYRGVIAARERIDLARTAIIQAEENLRLLQVRYRNGNATPTDIVDSEAALTRSQQRFFSATYTYLAALARLEYALGRQGAFLRQAADANRKQQPAPEEVPVSLKLPAIK